MSDRPPPPPPPAAPPGRERRLRILFALLSAVATLLALEGGIRVYDLARGRSVRARASWYWLYEQDPHLGFRGRAGARLTTPGDVVRHDAEGFRDDRDLATVATGDRRLVICVGESSTYGISAGTNEDTYPARLEAGLRASSGDPRWVVFNAGMPGYTSYEVLNLIRLRLLRARPEAIVAMSLRNDHEFIARSLDDAQDYDFYPLRVAQLSASFPNECLMRSSLYSLLVTRMRARFIDDLGGRQPARTYSEPTPRGLKMYRDDIAETAALCARSGVRLFYVDQPVDVRAYDTAKKESLAVLRQALVDACRENGVTLLPADARFDWSDLKPEDDVHLGATGYRRLAEILAPRLLAEMGDPAATKAAEAASGEAAPAREAPPERGTSSPAR